MIDKSFWKKIADNWRKDSDGIDIPDMSDVIDEARIIDTDEEAFDNISGDEIDDILADLGLDDI